MYLNYLDYLNPFMFFMGGSIMILSFLSLGMWFLSIISIWKVYQKAGKAGWEAFIPFYNKWILVEISGLKWWFFFITCANIILPSLGNLISLGSLFFCNYNLAKKFDKEPISYGIGLTILPIVFYTILAFSKNAVYNTEAEVSPYGPISEEKVKDFQNSRNEQTYKSTTSNKSNRIKFCKNCGEKIGNNKFCTNCGTEIK